MGNCASNHEEIDEQKMKNTKYKVNNIAVLTFAGPNAMQTPLPESQPTFSDPIFFSPNSSNQIFNN